MSNRFYFFPGERDDGAARIEIKSSEDPDFKPARSGHGRPKRLKPVLSPTKLSRSDFELMSTLVAQCRSPQGLVNYPQLARLWTQRAKTSLDAAGAEKAFELFSSKGNRILSYHNNEATIKGLRKVNRKLVETPPLNVVTMQTRADSRDLSNSIVTGPVSMVHATQDARNGIQADLPEVKRDVPSVRIKRCHTCRRVLTPEHNKSNQAGQPCPRVKAKELCFRCGFEPNVEHHPGWDPSSGYYPCKVVKTTRLPKPLRPPAPDNVRKKLPKADGRGRPTKRITTEDDRPRQKRPRHSANEVHGGAHVEILHPVTRVCVGQGTFVGSQSGAPLVNVSGLSTAGQDDFNVANSTGQVSFATSIGSTIQYRFELLNPTGEGDVVECRDAGSGEAANLTASNVPPRLSNLGNTCYQNAVVQVLRVLHPYHHDMGITQVPDLLHLLTDLAVSREQLTWFREFAINLQPLVFTRGILASAPEFLFELLRAVEAQAGRSELDIQMVTNSYSDASFDVFQVYNFDDRTTQLASFMAKAAPPVFIQEILQSCDNCRQTT